MSLIGARSENGYIEAVENNCIAKSNLITQETGQNDFSGLWNTKAYFQHENVSISTSVDTFVTNSPVISGDRIAIVLDDNSVNEFSVSNVTTSNDEYSVDVSSVTNGEIPKFVYLIDSKISFNDVECVEKGNDYIATRDDYRDYEVSTVGMVDPFKDSSGVALYQMDGNANDTGGNYNGTATDVTYDTGKFGDAGVFNGSSSKIDISETVNNNSSISFWCNNIGGDTMPNIYSTRTNDNGWQVETSTSGDSIGINDRESLLSNKSWTSAFTISPNTWVHVVVTLTSNKFRVYIDNTEVGNADINGTYSSTSSAFGYQGQFNSYWYSGSIDQVRIFNRALTQTEVTALYNEQIATIQKVYTETFDPFNDSSAVALYQMDGNANDTGGNYNGTATDVTYDVGKFGDCAEFNGSSSVIKIATDDPNNYKTITVWVKLNNEDDCKIAGYKVKSDDYLGTGINISNNSYEALTRDSGDNAETVNIDIADTTDWHFIAIIVDDGSLTLYVDDTFTNTSFNGNGADDNEFKLGCYYGTDDKSYFNGSLDQVRIFNRALTQQEVTALYNEQIATKKYLLNTRQYKDLSIPNSRTIETKVELKAIGDLCTKIESDIIA